MTNNKEVKRRRIAHEILGLTGISAALATILFLVLSNGASLIWQTYVFDHDIVMTEFDWIEADNRIFSISLIISVSFFVVLFLSLLADRLAYIRKLTQGIHALRAQQDHTIALEGNNELTELADAINHMSAAQRQIRQKEQALALEKEQFVRTMSHDIRTPLTSILAYSDYLSCKEDASQEEQKAYLQLLRKKAEQIRDLTDILLDGSKRNPEQFENAKLLIQQLAAEFEEALEEEFRIDTDLSGCPDFCGTFDVQELRRIFDNLSSNVKKYADPQQPVRLSVAMEEGQLLIRQSNAVRRDPPAFDSYKLGLNSIRRMAQYYDGQVAVQQTEKDFVISITLSGF